ncbi:MAG: LptF/LptG family permease [Alphaproteobacteria bacterium]|nr:LptF/LptG family permease [Alphaproteobacteria bacterium]
MARNFLISYCGVIAVLTVLNFLKYLIDYGRKSTGREDLTFDIVLEMSALRIPQTVELMTPIALLAAGMIAMWRLSRNNELVAIRAAGISVWQFLTPALLVAIAISAVVLGIINPLGADSLARHNALYTKYIDAKDRVFKVSSVGLWFREVDSAGITVIHADRLDSGGDSVAIEAVSVLLFDFNDRLRLRIDADRGELHDGYWRLINTVSKEPGIGPQSHEFIDLKTRQTVTQIQEGITEPDSVPFWKLPEVIALTEAAGFTAVRYRIHWNTLLASPVLFCAMMLIAATFTLRMPRRGGTMKLIIAGIMAGFIVELLKYVMVTLGNFGQVPVVLAAWTPAVAALMFGVAALFHVEDG